MADPRTHAHLNDPEVIRECLARHTRCVLDTPDLKHAAVLVPLFEKEGRLHLVFTRRSDTLSNHSGQISFPGGRAEPGDPTLEHTALRESHEEIGLRPEDVQVLGALDDITTLQVHRITPFVGLIPADYPFKADPGEVAYMIEVPLVDFMDSARLEVKHFPYPDGCVRPVYFYSMGDEIIWGATARIVKEWLDLLNACHGVDKADSEA